MDMLDVLKNREFDTVVLIEKVVDVENTFKKRGLLLDARGMREYRYRLINRLYEIRRKMEIFS